MYLEFIAVNSFTCHNLQKIFEFQIIQAHNGSHDHGGTAAIMLTNEQFLSMISKA